MTTMLKEKRTDFSFPFHTLFFLFYTSSIILVCSIRLEEKRFCRGRTELREDDDRDDDDGDRKIRRKDDWAKTRTRERKGNGTKVEKGESRKRKERG